MPIDATCPGCQAKLRIGDEFAGQQARCPRCDTIYSVPTLEQAALAAATAEPVAPADTAANILAPPVAAAPSSTPPARVEQASAETDLLSEVLAAVAAPEAEMPPADGTHWFLRTPEGPIYGPTSEGIFQRWVMEGRVTPDCFVSPGDHRWRPATEVFPELSAPRPQRTLRPETVAAMQKQPHRGVLILILGIMGILTTCPIPSIMAWVMGSHDLDEMQKGRMDDSGYSLTNAGRLLGMIFSALYIVGCVIAMFALVLIAARS